VTARYVADRASRALMLVGGAVAIVAIGAWLFDVLPNMPTWMLRLAVYKLALASGAGLMIAGAVVRRSLRAAATASSSPGARATAAAPSGAGALGAGPAPNVPPRNPEPERVRRHAEDQ